MKEHVIYALLDPETKKLRYVGYSSDAEQRYLEHYYKSALKPKTHKNDWLKSMLKQVVKAEMVILERYSTAEELPQAEVKMIAFCRQLGHPLTNGSDGGDGGRRPGFKHSEETKKKISEGHKGEKNHFYGKKHSDETKKIIGIKSKGRNVGEKSYMYGKPKSEETKKKISEGNHGKQMGENNHFYGEHHSEESKQKMSISSRGENSGRAKLTNDDVRFIKRALIEGTPNKELAIRFNVDASVISHIKHNRGWKHINL